MPHLITKASKIRSGTHKYKFIEVQRQEKTHITQMTIKEKIVSPMKHYHDKEIKQSMIECFIKCQGKREGTIKTNMPF